MDESKIEGNGIWGRLLVKEVSRRDEYWRGSIGRRGIECDVGIEKILDMLWPSL